MSRRRQTSTPILADDEKVVRGLRLVGGTEGHVAGGRVAVNPLHVQIREHRASLQALSDQYGTGVHRAAERPGGVGPVTPGGFRPLVEQYRAGLDAEMMLLHRLQAISVDQRRASQTDSVADIQTTVDDRARVMATLVTVERELMGIRQRLLTVREQVADLPEYREIVALHGQAADLVADILSVDQDSIEALEPAE